MTSHDSQQSPRTEPRFFYGYTIMVASLFISTASLSAHNSIGVFFKPLVIQFEWSRASLSGAVSVGLIVHGILAIVIGGISDRIGARLVTTICGAILGAGYILMSQVTNIWHVYLFFGLLVGAGMSGMWVPLMTTLAKWFVKRRGLMTGIVVTSTGIGPLLGPLATSWLISTYSWQTTYIIIGSLVLVVILVASQFLRRDPAQMGLLPDSEQRTETQEPKLITEGFSLKQAIYTAPFWFFFIMLFCVGFGYFSILVHIVPHATDLGISMVSAAGILAISGVLTIAGNVLLGNISDKIGIRRVMILSFILMAASLFWLLVAEEVWTLYLFAAVLGFGWGGLTALESPTVAWLFGLRSHGLILASVGFGLTIGASAGPYVTGYIFDKTGSYQYDFIICAALSVIGLLFTFVLRPTTKVKQKRV